MADADHQAVRLSRFVLVVCLLVGVRFVAVATTLGDDSAFGSRTAYSLDAERFHEIAQHAGTPYADFEVEYPPVTLAYIEAIDRPTIGGVMHRMAWSSLAFDLVIAAALAYGWGRRAALAYLVLGLAFLVWPWIYFRVDLLSVMLATVALALVRRRHQVAGGVGMAFAVVAKLWPIGMLPGFWVKGERRALGACVAAASALGIGWLLWSGTGGPEQVLTFRNATGWHVESVVGGVIRLFDAGDVITKQSGARRFGDAPTWATVLLGLVLVAVVAALWARTWRNQRDRLAITDGVTPLAVVAAFLVFSPLLAPQYLIWVMPFAAICWAAGEKRMASIAMVAVVLTMLLVRAYDAVNDARLDGQLLLTARNAAVVLLVVEGFVLTGRARPSDQSTRAGSGLPVSSSIRSSATLADAAVSSSTTI